MLKELVANIFFLQNVFSQKPEQFRFLVGMAHCPAWCGMGSSPGSSLASLNGTATNSKIAGNAYLGKYSS